MMLIRSQLGISVLTPPLFFSSYLKIASFMKQLPAVLTLIVLIFLSSCVVHRTAGNSGKVPPGQAKKAYGSKSAKPFAPGQQKK